MDEVARQVSPVDDHIEAAKEVRLRQELALVALGKRPADKSWRLFLDGDLEQDAHVGLGGE